MEYKKEKINTALLLAAGVGSRMQYLTNDSPKCLAEVSGVSILERLTLCLRHHGFKKLIVVVGYMDCCIREFLGHSINGLTIDYIVNNRYRTTNNIYSLWLAREMIHEPFLLVESDIVFDKYLLGKMLYPDCIAVSQKLPWMSGTTATINKLRRVLSLNLGQCVTGESSYKTVNIYSLSLPSWRLVEKRLEEHISSGHVNEYYEIVFAEMISEGSLSFKPVFFNAAQWYEIDTIKDLQKSELIFSKKLRKMGPRPQFAKIDELDMPPLVDC